MFKACVMPYITHRILQFRGRGQLVALGGFGDGLHPGGLVHGDHGIQDHVRRRQGGQCAVLDRENRKGWDCYAIPAKCYGVNSVSVGDNRTVPLSPTVIV